MIEIQEATKSQATEIARPIMMAMTDDHKNGEQNEEQRGRESIIKKIKSYHFANVYITSAKVRILRYSIKDKCHTSFLKRGIREYLIFYFGLVTEHAQAGHSGHSSDSRRCVRRDNLNRCTGRTRRKSSSCRANVTSSGRSCQHC